MNAKYHEFIFVSDSLEWIVMWACFADSSSVSHASEIPDNRTSCPNTPVNPAPRTKKRQITDPSRSYFRKKNTGRIPQNALCVPERNHPSTNIIWYREHGSVGWISQRP